MIETTRDDAERKQVTVLFADVSGSMDLAEQQDPEEWRKIMQSRLLDLILGRNALAMSNSSKTCA